MIDQGQTIKADDIQMSNVMFTNMIAAAPCPSFWSDVPALCSADATTLRLVLLDSNTYQTINATSDWAAANFVRSVVIIGAYLYALLEDSDTAPDTYRVYRYSRDNIAAGGTLVTFSGATVLTTTDSEMRMSSDGTNFYFNYQAGNSANDYVLAKYTFSGTTFTYSTSVTCGSTANSVLTFHVRATNGDIIALNSAYSVIRRFNSSGALQTTSIAYDASNINGLSYINDFFLYLNNDLSAHQKMIRIPIT